MLRRIGHELKHHAPFTLGGTFAGAVVLAAMVYGRVSHEIAEGMFGAFHPAHVFFSALTTAALYRRYAKGKWWATLLVGCIGSLVIGTLSDSLVPYLGEWLFGVHAGDGHGMHIGFIELWYLVNPLAVAGALLGFFWPRTRAPHALHVLLSTAASLAHMAMAMTEPHHAHHGPAVWVGLPAFLFLAVWVPCCTSDIIFPLLFVPKENWEACKHCHR